jgi:hypothetical protein
VTAFADGDYTTNMGLEDVADGRAWIAAVGISRITLFTDAGVLAWFGAQV